MQQFNFDELEQALRYSFSDRSLLLRALTHSSRANEANIHFDNERLEFLGDSILGWLISEWLFSRFADFNEGQLSGLKNHLVSATHLIDAAQRLDLGRYVQLGRGEESAGGRAKQRILVNAFEAVLGAVYLDGGPDAARDIVENHVLTNVAGLPELAKAGPPHDYRAEAERLAREMNLPSPDYVLVGESGPGHAKTFTVAAHAGREFTASASGSSKKNASRAAARRLSRMLRGEIAPNGVEDSARDNSEGSAF